MYTYIKHKDDLDVSKFLISVGSATSLSIDTEANSLDPISAEWILMQVSTGAEIYLFDARTLDRKFLSNIISLINLSGKKVLAHNSKYDLKIISIGTGILIENIYDTMISESIIYRGIGKVFYSLVDLVEKYSGEILNKEVRTSFENLTGDLSIEQLSYSALDVRYLNDIFEKQSKLILERGLERIIELEMNLIPAIVRMELTGVYLDRDEWMDLEQKAIKDAGDSKKKVIDTIMSKIDFESFPNSLALSDYLYIPVTTKKARLALETIVDPAVTKDWIESNININSNKQLLNILTKLYHMDIDSTDEKVLKDINDEEIIPHLLSYRGNTKKVTTYGEDFLKHVNKSTGRIHSEFLQNGTTSGRFSSTNPNLQNIPAEKEYRKPFKATEGKAIVSWDYSQQEYRLAGAISKDKVIIDSYVSGKDMHTATASIIFGKALDAITKEERSLGKTINFAVLYGSTSYGLAFNLKISKGSADDFLNKFYDGYPTLTRFKRMVEDEIWRRKYSSTVLGRKRYWEDRILFVDNRDAFKYEQRVRREGFNHIIQGTGADVTKLAMIKMFRDNPFGDSFKLIMQVHDEIVAEIDESISNEALEFGKKCMVDVFQPFLGVIPASVEGTVGKHWSK